MVSNKIESRIDSLSKLFCVHNHKNLYVIQVLRMKLPKSRAYVHVQVNDRFQVLPEYWLLVPMV